MIMNSSDMSGVAYTPEVTSAGLYTEGGGGQHPVPVSPPNAGTPTVFLAMEIVVCVVGFITNLQVVVVMLSDRGMLAKRTNLYITCQSVLDGMVAVTTILSRYLGDHGRFFDTPADILYCYAWVSTVPVWTLIGASTYNLVAMTTERYLSVVKPVWHKVHVTRGVVWGSMVGAWLTAFLFQLAVKMPFQEVRDGRCTRNKPLPQLKKAMGVLTVAFYYFIPVSFILLTYGHMAYSLRTRVSPLTTTTGNVREQSMTRARKNVLKTLILVIVAFIACWTLNQITYLLLNLGYNVDRTSDYFFIIRVFIVVNCAINPFIYVAKYTAYQKALGRLVGRVTRGRLGWGDEGSATIKVTSSTTG